jgi:hypothetical protein
MRGIPGNSFGRIAALALGLTAVSQGDVLWQTTHTFNEGGGYNSGGCTLASASLKVGVHPGFLDVEEDVEIGVVGGVSLGNDGNSLEVVGNFNLPTGSAITGALLWDGKRILQGKLLDKHIAAKLYDSLVDRNSVPPPRPRDPLLIEKLPDGGYRFRIYPVAVGHARHMRLRYQLPPSMSGEALLLPVQGAVIPQFQSANLKVAVNFVNADHSPLVIYSTNGGGRSEMALPRTRLLSPAELSGGGIAYDVWASPWNRFPPPGRRPSRPAFPRGRWPAIT